MPIAGFSSATSLMVMVRLCSKPALSELEGIVSKHSLAPYRSGRSKTWLKTKCFTEFHLRGGRD